MAICPCACPSCNCEERCLCCPKCCSCTECLDLRKSITCSNCKEHLNSRTGVQQAAAITHSGYPGVNFNKLPDLSFINSNVPPDTSGNPSMELKPAIEHVNIQSAATAVRQNISESRTTSEEQPFFIFPMDNVGDNPGHSETKDSAEQTPPRLEFHGSFQNIFSHLDESDSSVTLEYSPDSSTEIFTHHQSSSAPTKCLVGCKSNESSPCRLVGCPGVHLSISQQVSERLCISAPSRSTAPCPFFSPDMSTISTSPQSSPTESGTPFLPSGMTMLSASQAKISASKEATESRKTEDLTSNQHATLEKSIASTSHVVLCPQACDSNSQVRGSVSSAKDLQLQLNNLTLNEISKQNSSLEGISLVQEKNTEASSLAQQQLQSSETPCTSSQHSSSPSCASCDGPVSPLVRKSYSPQNSVASQSSNSSETNNGEISNMLSARVISSDHDNPELSTSVFIPALEQVTQVVANRTVPHSGNILVLMILFNSFRHN